MGASIHEYNLGDLVENTSYLRKPRLHGIIVACLGYNQDLGDLVYKIYCYNTGRYEKWRHGTVRKIS
jgi:hypothetical protein